MKILLFQCSNYKHLDVTALLVKLVRTMIRYFDALMIQTVRVVLIMSAKSTRLSKSNLLLFLRQVTSSRTCGPLMRKGCRYRRNQNLYDVRFQLESQKSISKILKKKGKKINYQNVLLKLLNYISCKFIFNHNLFVHDIRFLIRLFGFTFTFDWSYFCYFFKFSVKVFFTFPK